MCNGIQNCDGGEDEDASVTGPCHEENCPFSYFRCEDKQACVPKTWVCDGDNDCEDNSDEQLCRKFVVIHMVPDTKYLTLLKQAGLYKSLGVSDP